VPATFDDRLVAVERLLALFRMERLTYLAVTGIALVMLLGGAALLVARGDASPATMTMLLGPSGLIATSLGRLLRMWDQAIQLIAQQQPATEIRP
jgi:hypothetical protein